MGGQKVFSSYRQIPLKIQSLTVKKTYFQQNKTVIFKANTLSKPNKHGVFVRFLIYQNLEGPLRALSSSPP